MGCTSVKNGYTAHDRGSCDHEPLSGGDGPVGAILVPTENGRESWLDNPPFRHLNLQTAHQREDVQYGFVPLNPRITKVDFAAAHDRGQIPSAELLRRAS